jgi:hypothetical protein
VRQALFDRLVAAVEALEFHEARDLAHRRRLSTIFGDIPVRAPGSLVVSLGCLRL